MDHGSPSDETAAQVLVADSARSGWRALRVRRFVQRPVVDLLVPATPDQKVTVLVGGRKDAAVRHGRVWRRAVLGPGSVSMTAPGRDTRIRWHALSEERLDHVSLHLPAGTMRRAAAEVWDDGPARDLPDAFDAEDPLLPRLVPDLLRAAATGAGELYAESAAEFLAIHLLTQHRRPPRVLRGVEDARVRQVRAMLQDRLAEPVGLAELAAEVGLSRHHLLRVFRQQTGETPARFQTRLRMQRASRLLLAGIAVAEVARSCGYADASQFARAFRRETGSTPSALRGSPARTLRLSGREPLGPR